MLTRTVCLAAAKEQERLGHLMDQVPVDRRRRSVETPFDRRSEVVGHRIVMAPHLWRLSCWTQGTCECGETTVSRLDGIVEAWARYHKLEVQLPNWKRIPKWKPVATDDVGMRGVAADRLEDALRHVGTAIEPLEHGIA